MRTLIYGGRVIDPANSIDGQVNVLIENGKILSVRDDDMEADERINAAGKIVCPGFVDVHVHEDPVEDGHIYADEDRAVFACMLRMGVTTVVGGNCGDNVYDPADYLDLVDRDGAAVNVAMLAGHGYFRALSGTADNYAGATEEQIRFIADGFARSLARGCAGVSYGIRYVPGAEKNELLKTAAACVPDRKPAACHLRDDAGYVFDALDEFMSVIRSLDIPAEISHVGSMAGFGQMDRFLSSIEKYKRSGADVMCDCYPYSAFSTGLGSATYDDGWMERYGCGYDVVELCEGKYKGQRCTKESFAEVRRDFPQCLTVCHVMRPEEIGLALAHPDVMLASDTTLSHGHGHPRAAGTFPRLIAEYVRSGQLDLYDAIEKMTVLPAERFNLPGKGELSPGADADIVIFDLERIRDRATFENPVLPPEGINAVFIGGQLAAKDGKIVNHRLGRAVRVF